MNKPLEPVNIAILGATGRVGQELLKVMEERDFPVSELRLLASARSKDTTMTFKGKSYPVSEPTEAAFKGIDIVLASAGESISREISPMAVAQGATVIDNSNAFRMEPDVPLVVVGVNEHALHNHKGIVANPNCSTAQLVVPQSPCTRSQGSSA